MEELLRNLHRNLRVWLPDQDSEELLRNLHLAPYAKPMVSLVDDFPVVQKHKGWQFGYMADNTTKRMTCALFAPWLHPITIPAIL